MLEQHPDAASRLYHLPHPWDLRPDQLRSLACCWCGRSLIGEPEIPAGTTSVTHTYGRVVEFRLQSCGRCAS